MGLLDDAIREHLDLKRRRGADPSEVERAEREALGPVRRAQAPQDADLAEAPVGVDDVDEPVDEEFEPGFEAGEDELPPLEEEAAEPQRGRAFDHEDEDDDDWTYEEPPPVARRDPDPGPATAVHEPDFDEEELFGEPDPEPEPEPEPERSRVAPPPHPAGGETIEYDVKSALGDEEPAEGEDMLEETPDFLQDTPDHDRLWFEQRPPRDFDFNE